MARKLSWGRKNDLGVSLSIKKDHHEVSRGIKKPRNHHAPAVQYATDFRTKRDNNKKDDLTAGLTCNVKLFADDTSLFTIVQDSTTAANDMNHDLELIKQWANNWRMSFNC